MPDQPPEPAPDCPDPPAGKPGRAGAADAAAVMLAGGATVRATAKKVGVAERTLYHWKRKPKFAARVSELRGALVDSAVGELSGTMVTAAQVLRKLLKSKSEAVRMRAAKSLLELAVAVRDHAELERRLADIEAKLAGGGS